MRWSEMKTENFYMPYDENQRVIRGFFLRTLNLDLNNIPYIFWEPFTKFERIPYSHSTERKIYVRDIIGTVHEDYGGLPLIQAYMRLKRGDKWILQGEVTSGKYFCHLKKSTAQQMTPICVSPAGNGKYFLNSNGNHRTILYKLMMMAEIYEKKHYYISENEYLDYRCFQDVSNKYWLNASVSE